jgi:hypothetical protein
MNSIKKLLKSAPRMRNTLPQNITRGNGVRNPQKAEAYVGKGVLKNGDTVTSIKGSISPVPNGPLIKRKGIVRGVSVKGSTLKTGGKVKVMAGGEKHVVYKAAKNTTKSTKGDIIVNHPTKDKGKWDTINLTRKGKAKTVKQGVAATKKWHRDNPDYNYKGMKKSKAGALVPKRSSVSRRLGSAKTSIGNMRFTKKKK